MIKTKITTSNYQTGSELMICKEKKKSVIKLCKSISVHTNPDGFNFLFSSVPCDFAPCKRDCCRDREKLQALHLPLLSLFACFHHSSHIVVSNMTNFMKTSPTMILIPFQHDQVHNWVWDHLTSVCIMQQPEIIAQIHDGLFMISRKHTCQPLHTYS